MKFVLATLPALLLTTLLTGQIYNPVSWQHHAIQTGGDTYEIIFQADVEKGWYIYSQYLEGEDGPIPTSFNFDEAASLELIGENQECELNREEVFDKLFSMDLVKYKKKAYFRQSVKIDNLGDPLTGYLEFMTCDDRKCLPPAQVDFEIDLKKSLDGASIKYSNEALCRDAVSFIAVNTAPEEQPRESDPITPDASPAVKKVVKQEKPQVQQAVHTTKASSAQSTSIPAVSTEADASFGTVSIGGADLGENDDNIEDPVIWEINVADDGGDVFTIALNAKIESDWHIYSSTLEREDGPIKTSITIEENNGVSIQGDIEERADKVVREHDKYFDMLLTKLKSSATISQKVKVSDPEVPIRGFLEYMACTHDRCLPPQFVDFEVDAKNKIGSLGLDLGDMTEAMNSSDGLEEMFGLSYAALQDPVGTCVEKVEQSKSLWKIFILGFIGGLIALLTPCVFPMIPLTVSFFTKSTEKKGKGLFNAIFYGFSILLVYVVISVPFHVLDTVNPNILNDISTNVWLNIFFFLIFLFFAFSFFGYFDLTLPASVTNKISAAEGIGGVIGIFFMALTLALVSFSCTGPILGSLLAGSLTNDGGAWQLTSGFTGFGLALGLPFGLFAAFPSMMSSLPKSGGWLNTVKVVLGFIELALAFKFLSNADLVKQWGLLKIEPFLIIWILIAVGMAIYLFGKLKFPHDSPIKKLSFGRVSLAVLTLAFAVYMASGFRYSDRTGSYQPLSLLSGLAPPVCYSIIHKCKCPQGLECYKDLNEGLTYAKSVNKPVLLDFTGHACVNCRKMEEHVWPEPEVYKYLKDEFVLVSLYVDEKIELPEEEQVTLPRRSGGSQKMRYTGNRWAYFQTEYFNINSQPYYVLMTPEGQLLNNPVSYTPDKHEYAEFLECGLKNYRQLGMK